MIIIKMHQNNWRIQIGNEIWEFERLEEMQRNLNLILKIKDEFGKLKGGTNG